jgi:hypothetical protein
MWHLVYEFFSTYALDAWRDPRVDGILASASRLGEEPCIAA